MRKLRLCQVLFQIEKSLLLELKRNSIILTQNFKIYCKIETYNFPANYILFFGVEDASSIAEKLKGVNLEKKMLLVRQPFNFVSDRMITLIPFTFARHNLF